MSLRNAHTMVKTVVEGNKLLEMFGNKFTVVSQKQYKGKPEKGLEPGTTFVLQILEDHSEPVIDKATGLVLDNNVMETFEVTVPGCAYPSEFKKGDLVSLGGFMEEASYYINYSLILRFKSIKRTSGAPNSTPAPSAAAPAPLQKS